MDGSRFDGLTRKLANKMSRRQTLHGLASGTLAGLLAHVGLEDAAAGCVKPGKNGCAGPRRKLCCKGARCIGGNVTKEGRCICRGTLKQCGTTCVNLRTDPKHCGSCTKTCGGRTCTRGMCAHGCRAGEGLQCDDPDPQAHRWPGNNNPDCLCLTDIHGTPRCADFFSTAICDECSSNAECGPGNACFEYSCGCPNTGTACVKATCNELR